MRIIPIFGIALGLAAGAAQSQEISAVAISPDGTTLLVAGDNRVIYTVDPETLNVLDRRYESGRITWMEFSSDGENLYILMEDERFIALTAGSFKQRFLVDDVDAVSYAPESNRMALLENKYDGGILRIVQAANGKEMSKITFPDIDTELVALSPDGARALILTDDDQSEDEPKLGIPSDLKDYDKYVFRQKNDGYLSQVLDVDLKAGTYTATRTYYRVSYPEQVRMLGDDMLIIKDRDDSAVVPADGSASMLNLGEGFISKARISDDGQSMMLNSSNKVAIVPLANGAVGEPSSEYEVDRIEGPTEHVTAADESSDGTLYMGTNAYRLWKLTPGGEEIEVSPIF